MLFFLTGFDFGLTSLNEFYMNILWHEWSRGGGVPIRTGSISISFGFVEW
jgi:hypothetical protein